MNIQLQQTKQIKYLLLPCLLLQIIIFNNVHAKAHCNPNKRGVNVIIGTNGDDILKGTNGNDVILGKGGNDVIYGLKGNDCIDGGTGNDKIIGGKGRDRIFGGKGNDILKGQKGNDLLNGGKGKDVLFAGRGRDICISDLAEKLKGCERVKTKKIKPSKPVVQNLAYKKTTRQSSTIKGGHSKRAVDGKTNGNYRKRSTTHTKKEKQPFWEVDLGAVKDVGKIKIYNRTDCCSKRLKNYYILVSEKPFDSKSLAQLLADKTVFKKLKRSPLKVSEKISVNRKGRYVRVQLRGRNYLSLSEVQVFAGDVVTPPATNQTPILKTIANQVVLEENQLTFEISASDKDLNDKLSFSAQGLPNGANLKDNGNGNATFTWTPQIGTAGKHSIVISVTDNNKQAASDKQTVIITVNPKPVAINNPPVLNVQSNHLIEEDQALNFLVNATDPDTDNKLSFSTSSLPPGASLKDNSYGSASFSWTPQSNDVGNHSIIISVSDDHTPAASTNHTVNITVTAKKPLVINNPPVFSALGNQVVEAGLALNFTVNATDKDLSDQLSFSATGMPSGAVLINNGDRTASFKWTTQTDQAGAHSFEINVKDNHFPAGMDKLLVNITVIAANTSENQTCSIESAEYANNVHDDLLSSCAGACHSPAGIAPGFIVTDDVDSSFQSINAYTALLAGNSATLVEKSIAQPFHGGGNIYSNSSDPRYQQLHTLSTKLPCNVDQGQGNTTALQGISLISERQTLRSAALTLLGRLPTQSELNSSNDLNGLRTTLRVMLDSAANDGIGNAIGQPLREFLYFSGLETFLSEGAAGVDKNTGLKKEDFPALELMDEDLLGQVDVAAKKEPIMLLDYIVTNDLPWTEMLTADYTMVNPVLAQAYQANMITSFTNPNNNDEWKPARIPAVTARLPNRQFPHAGVISSNSWLSRFPTTPTNRNRHRVAMLFQQFLGYDIELKGERADANANLGNFLVPTMENPACTQCHREMDTVAGAFQNWGEDNGYWEKGTDSLDYAYKSNRYYKDASGNAWYQQNDNWYRDIFAPGYGMTKMPGGHFGYNQADISGIIPNIENDNGSIDSLPWMALELIQDSRFAKGGVHFWYKALFKRKPLTQPQDDNEPDYADKQAAYQLQNAILEDLAVYFSSDNGHGEYNVKDLLIALVTSDLYRASKLNGADATDPAIADLGIARLLTAPELAAKTRAVTGSPWSEFEGEAWQNPLGLLYYGFDGGDSISKPTSELTALLHNIPIHLGLKTACNAIVRDLRKPRANRNLTAFVNSEAKSSQVMRQVWDNIAGEDITLLTTNYRYPDNPSTVDFVDDFEAPRNTGSNFGQRLSAILVPPATGDYTFWIAGDDYSLLQLSSDDTEENISTIAFIDGYTNYRQWDKFSSQQSQTIRLQAGQRYYLQAVGKEGGGGDHLSVAWQGPSISAITVIDGTHLEPVDGLNTPVMPLNGTPEQLARQNIQHLHWTILGEELALDDIEVDRTYLLYQSLLNNINVANNGADCGINDTYDPNYVQRAWAGILLYLMTDIHYLYQ